MDEDIGKGWKILLGICASVGAVFGLVLFTVLSGGSILGYVFATIGGIALGLIVASWIRHVLDSFDF
jgi:zinc transporter ZupT